MAVPFVLPGADYDKSCRQTILFEDHKQMFAIASTRPNGSSVLLWGKHWYNRILKLSDRVFGHEIV